MSEEDRAKNQVMEQCFDVPIEEQGLNMLKHYEYLVTLNHEWNSLCEKAIKNYIPNLNKIKKLEKDNKIMREALEYYADMPTQYMVLMNLDVNEKARKALKQISGGK